MRLVLKAHVKGHYRTTRLGKRVYVKEHDDSRSKKEYEEKVKRDNYDSAFNKKVILEMTKASFSKAPIEVVEQHIDFENKRLEQFQGKFKSFEKHSPGWWYAKSQVDSGKLRIKILSKILKDRSSGAMLNHPVIKKTMSKLDKRDRDILSANVDYAKYIVEQAPELFDAKTSEEFVPDDTYSPFGVARKNVRATTSHIPAMSYLVTANAYRQKPNGEKRAFEYIKGIVSDARKARKKG